MSEEKLSVLEALEDLSKLVFIYGGVEQYKIIETALKALEIIKNKQVDVGALIELDLELYNKYVIEINGTPTLTQEEYDLVRRVLL